MRLIDKDALLDQLKELLKNKKEEAAYAGRRESSVCFDDAITTIKNAPTIEQEPQWIPCSERLPEEDECVLVTVYFMGLTQKHKNGWCDHIKPKHYVDIARHIDGEWSSYSDEYKAAKDRHIVIAWMPLPEPYDGDKND